MWRDFKSMNEAILEFGNRPENKTLLTKSYCTPFRGPLFGKHQQKEIEHELKTRRVEVLILGSNPNAGDHATVSNKVRVQYGSLPQQIATGLFSEQYFLPDGTYLPGWTPFADKKRGWKFLLGAIEASSVDLNSVTMANAVPWGSELLPKFFEALDVDTQERVIEFSETLSDSLITILKPKLVIVSRSLTNLPILKDTAYARNRQKNCQHIAMPFIKSNGPSTLNVFEGVISRAGSKSRILHLGHPSYLSRISAQELERLKPLLTEVITHSLSQIN